MISEFQKRILSSIVLVPVVFFSILKGSYFFDLLILICIVFSFYEWFFMSRRKPFFIWGYIFLIFSFFSVYQIRNNFSDDGIFYILLVTLVCISTDLGGYIFGKLFKGPKLTKISPNKTYSGVIGSFVLSILISILFVNFISNFRINYITIGINNLLIFVFLVSMVSQIGDIIISYFKRISNIKDTGKLIPGHGGILDRIDGMLFAFPFSYVFFYFKII